MNKPIPTVIASWRNSGIAFIIFFLGLVIFQSCFNRARFLSLENYYIKHATFIVAWELFIEFPLGNFLNDYKASSKERILSFLMVSTMSLLILFRKYLNQKEEENMFDLF
jgi:hypothetical protein